MRLAKSTLGLRDGYGDKQRIKRNEMLPRLQTGQDSMMGAHEPYMISSSPLDNVKRTMIVGPRASPVLPNEPPPTELSRRRTLSRKLSIKSFRQWIQNQRGRSPCTPITAEQGRGGGLMSNHHSDSMIKASLNPGGICSECESMDAIGLIKPESECTAVTTQAARLSVINRKKSGRVSSDLISSRSSLSPASSGTTDELPTPAAEDGEMFDAGHPYHFPKPIGEKNGDAARSSPPPPYRSPVQTQLPRRRIPTNYPSLPSVSLSSSLHQQSYHHHHHPHPHRHHHHLLLLRSPSSVPHLNLTHTSPPSHLLSLPVCTSRFGIPCVIDMASNLPPLRQPIPTLLSSSSPPLAPSVPSTHDASSNGHSDPRIPLPARDELSIAPAAPGIGNKVTDLDQRLTQLDNLHLSPVINKIIDSSTPVSSVPSSLTSSDPHQPPRAYQPPLNSLITNNLLPTERTLSVVEEDLPADQAHLNSPALNSRPSNGLRSISMFEPNPSLPSPSSHSLSTIHPNQMIPPEHMSRSPTRSPAAFSPESTSPIPDRLSSSGPSSRLVKSAATTKLDVSHKHGETHVVAKSAGLAEKKSVFGKLFDRRNDVKATIGGSTSTEGSGNESESNTLGVGAGAKKSAARKASTKAGGCASDACSNPGSTALNEPEGISGPGLMALQGSLPPPTSAVKPKPGSERGGEDRPFGGSSKLRDMVGGKLGRKPSSSKGGRSEDGKSEDGENRSRAGSQATTSLLKKYGVCEKVAIGKGATAVVRLAHKWDRGTDKLYAVKEFRKRRKNESEKEYVKKLTSEFCISSTLHHENIVETVDLVQDENQHWCEVMEYCPGGDLYAAIKRGSMKQHEINSYFKQLLNGIAYLHQMGVAHRDIKPENLLLDGKGRIKITDFGVSDVFRMCWEKTSHLSKGLCGSEPYLPKEIFERKEYDARLIDVWSCGIVYYCCCIQELPWRVAKKTDPSYMSFVESYESSLTPTPLINLIKDSRKIIKKMLHPEPEGRVQIDEVLQDEWVAGLQVLAV